MKHDSEPSRRPKELDEPTSKPGGSSIAKSFLEGSRGVSAIERSALIELERHEEAAAFGERCIAQGLKSPVFRRYIGEALFRAQAFGRAAERVGDCTTPEPNQKLRAVGWICSISLLDP